MVGETLPCRPRPPHGGGRVCGELGSRSGKKTGATSGGRLWSALPSVGQHAGRRARRSAAHRTIDARMRRLGSVVRGGDVVLLEAEAPELGRDVSGERKKGDGGEMRPWGALVGCGVSQDKGGLQVEGEKK